MSEQRWRCSECRKISLESEFLTAPHPFSEGTIVGCPHCRELPYWHLVCDEPGCDADHTCGTPSPHGYRMTCNEHMPRETKP